MHEKFVLSYVWTCYQVLKMLSLIRIQIEVNKQNILDTGDHN